MQTFLDSKPNAKSEIIGHSRREEKSLLFGSKDNIGELTIIFNPNCRIKSWLLQITIG